MIKSRNKRNELKRRLNKKIYVLYIEVNTREDNLWSLIFSISVKLLFLKVLYHLYFNFTFFWNYLFKLKDKNSFNNHNLLLYLLIHLVNSLSDLVSKWKYINSFYRQVICIEYCLKATVAWWVRIPLTFAYLRETKIQADWVLL